MHRFVVIAVFVIGTVSIFRAEGEERDAYHWASLLEKGVNISCALEAPEEGKWGVIIEEEHLDVIRDAGFRSIRLPVRWNSHAAEQAPYAVDPAFLKRVDQVLRWALDRELVVVVNWHHYLEFRASPEAHKERFFAIWEQLAEHYRDWSPTLYFEVLNEPAERLTSELWNTYQNEAIRIIRETNPTRAIVVSPIKHGSVEELDELDLPEGDRNIIVTFHLYVPYRFTHQGVQRPGQSANPEGITWGSEADRKRLSDLVAAAAEFGERSNRPVWLGEFGTYYKTELAERVKWAAYVRSEAEKHFISWAYWSFCSAKFGLYDQGTRRWNGELMKAMFPSWRE